MSNWLKASRARLLYWGDLFACFVEKKQKLGEGEKCKEMASAGEFFLQADRADRLFCLLSGAEARYLR